MGQTHTSYISLLELPRCYQSITNHDSLLIIDLGASVCIMPHQLDFITYAASNMKIKDLSYTVAGEGLMRWKDEDLAGCVVNLDLPGYHIPGVEVHLLAVSLLDNLETARQWRSVLLSVNQKLLVKERKKGFAKNTKINFMSFKTDSCKAWMYVYLTRISKEMHMNCDVSICLILVSYVGTQEWCGDDVVALPPHIPMRYWAQHLRPDSTVWPDHTYHIWPCQRAKNTLVLYGV